jgi:hypothetical protein
MANGAVCVNTGDPIVPSRPPAAARLMPEKMPLW